MGFELSREKTEEIFSVALKAPVAPDGRMILKEEPVAASFSGRERPACSAKAGNSGCIAGQMASLLNSLVSPSGEVAVRVTFHPALQPVTGKEKSALPSASVVTVPDPSQRPVP